MAGSCRQQHLRHLTIGGVGQSDIDIGGDLIDNPLADTNPLCTLVRQSPGLKLDIEIEGCGVDIPDPNLRAAIEKALGKGAGTTITADEMATLTLTAQR